MYVRTRTSTTATMRSLKQLLRPQSTFSHTGVAAAAGFNQEGKWSWSRNQQTWVQGAVFAAAATATATTVLQQEPVEEEEEDCMVNDRPGFSQTVAFPYSPVYTDHEGRPLKLVHVVTVTRHGDRSPIASHLGEYGKDIERIDDEWFRRLTKQSTASRLETWCPRQGVQKTMDEEATCRGKLTEIGVAQLEQTGKAMRTIYATEKFYREPPLPSECNSDLIYARSTNFERCIQSMQSLLLGLYPPTSRGARSDSTTSSVPEEESIPGISEYGGLPDTSGQYVTSPITVRPGHIPAKEATSVDQVENLYPRSAGACKRLDRSFADSREALKNEVDQVVKRTNDGFHQMKDDEQTICTSKEIKHCLRCRESARYIWKAFGLVHDRHSHSVTRRRDGQEEIIPWIRVRDILLGHFTHQIDMGLTEVGMEMFPIASHCAEVEMTALFRVPCDEVNIPKYGNYVGKFGPKTDSRQFEAVRYSIGLFLHELHQVLASMGRGNSKHTLVAYLAHDATLLPLLYMLGYPASTWPPYAATITIEIFRVNQEGGSCIRHFARVLYNGEPLPLATYSDTKSKVQETTLLPLELLQKVISPFAIESPETFCKECDS